MAPLCPSFDGLCIKCNASNDGNDANSEQMGEFWGWGPLNPSREENFDIIRNLFTEIHQVFPDNYIHLGGDEVPDNCWFNDPEVATWAEEKGFTSNTEIQQYYMKRIYDICNEIGFKYIVWDEVFSDSDVDPDADLPVEEKPTVHLWFPWENPQVPHGWEPTMKKVVSTGHHAILSSTWYLDIIERPNDNHDGYDWSRYYKTDPREFISDYEPLTEEEKLLVDGGVGCYWSEYVDTTGFLPRTFPRISSIAEKLWSKFEDTQDIEDALPRIDQFRCRLISRGIPAEPAVVPSSCAKEYDVKYRPPWEQ